MFSQASASWRKLTRAVSDRPGFERLKAHFTTEMGDQETDYSSLPLLDRFAHKVRSGTCGETVYMLTALCFATPAGVESAKGSLRGCSAAVCQDGGRVRSSIQAFSARPWTMERSGSGLERSGATRGHSRAVRLLEVRWSTSLFKVGCSPVDQALSEAAYLQATTQDPKLHNTLAGGEGPFFDACGDQDKLPRSPFVICGTRHCWPGH